MRKPELRWLGPYLIVILGGGLLITGVFLPWYRVKFIDGEELTINALGWNSNLVKIVPDLELFGLPWTDGLEILLLGIFLVGLTLIYFWSNFNLLKWVLPFVSLLSVWQVFFGFDFDSHLATINFWNGQDNLSLSVSSQPVILLAWVGSLLALSGSIWLFFRNLKRTSGV